MDAKLLETVYRLVEENAATAMYDLTEKIPTQQKQEGLDWATKQIQADHTKENMAMAVPKEYADNDSVVAISDAAYRVYQEQVNNGRNRFASWVVACGVFNRAFFELILLKDIDMNWVEEMTKDAVDKPIQFVLSSLVVGFLKQTAVLFGAAVVSSVASRDRMATVAATNLTSLYMMIAMNIASFKLLYKMYKRDPKTFEVKPR